MQFLDLNAHYDTLRAVFGESLLQRLGIRRQWYEIDGWFNWRSAQEEAVNSFRKAVDLSKSGLIWVAVSVRWAKSSSAVAKYITVIGVDTCRGSGPKVGAAKTITPAPFNREVVPSPVCLHKNLLDCGFGDKIQLIISDSVAAARLFAEASLDWVHLDARHDYASVKADIEAWLPKIKAGGWLSGDDYNEQKWPDVVKAVGDLLPGAELWSKD